MNSVQKQYFREIKDLLPCNARQRRRCVMELEDTVSSFLEDNPDATLDDLHEAFGSPESIAEAFLEQLSPEEFSKKISRKKQMCFGIIIFPVLAIILGVVALDIARSVHEIQTGHFADYVEDTTEPPVVSHVKVY